MSPRTNTTTDNTKTWRRKWQHHVLRQFTEPTGDLRLSSHEAAVVSVSRHKPTTFHPHAK